MRAVTNWITISRPIEDVFAVLIDVENTGKSFLERRGAVDLAAARPVSAKRGAP